MEGFVTRKFLELSKDWTPRRRSWEVLGSIPANSQMSTAFIQWLGMTHSPWDAIDFHCDKADRTYICKRHWRGPCLVGLVLPLSGRYLVSRGRIYPTSNAIRTRNTSPEQSCRDVLLLHLSFTILFSIAKLCSFPIFGRAWYNPNSPSESQFRSRKHRQSNFSNRT